jgi:C-terminal processing protease CtpA/Prc
VSAAPQPSAATRAVTGTGGESWTDRSSADLKAHSESGSGSGHRAVVEDALAALRRRVAAVEARLDEQAAASPAGTTDAAPEGTSRSVDADVLVAAGVAREWADEYLRRQDRLELRRLQLRDRASREGWIGSGRFREELRRLDGSVTNLRQEIGDEAYDRVLYLTGQPNRVVVESVIDESPAHMSGLQAGDVVLGYADSRIFSYSDLRDATRAGARDEYVVLRVQREGETLDLSLPRGPLGIRMALEQIDPDAITAEAP